MLSYADGREFVFPCNNKLQNLSTAIVQKQLDTSFGGRKRLNTLVPDIAITNQNAKRSDRDIVVSIDDMDTIFNLVPIGAEVIIN